MPKTIVHAPEFQLYFYGSILGAGLSFIIISIMLFQTIRYYIKTFYTSNERSIQNKAPYILFYLLCFVALIMDFCTLFVRSNIITRQSLTSITGLQCHLGYFTNLVIGYITFFIIYIILINRIRVSFEGSVYKYHNYVYSTLNIILIIMILSSLASCFMLIPHTRFYLYKFDSTNNIWCSAEAKKNSQNALWTAVATASLIAIIVIFSIILIYMFTKRLYALQLVLLNEYMGDNNYLSSKSVSNDNNKTAPAPVTPPSAKFTKMQTPTPSVVVTPPSANDPQPDAQSPDSQPKQLKLHDNVASNSNDDFKVDMKEDMPKEKKPSFFKKISLVPLRSTPKAKRIRTMTIEQIREVTEQKENNSSARAAKRIYNLHALIKKHTALILIASGADLAWLLANFFDSFWWFPQLPYLVLIHAICVWLQFGFTKKYWDFVTKYVFCCCRWLKRRDVTSRTCCLFC